MLERLLILINEVVNLQRVISELVNNNDLFNRTVAGHTLYPHMPSSALEST